MESNLSVVDELLHVGTSQSVITPPVGFDISGPEFPQRPALGIDDDLCVRCVAFKSYGQAAIIASLDVWAIADWLVDRISHAISDATGVSKSSVFILATGNGTSPPLCCDESDLPDQYRNYAAYLPQIVAGTALEACLSLEPAAAATVSATLPNLNCFRTPNRPEPLETERERLQLTTVRTSDDQVACVLYNFACPATIVGNTQRWTADFPGMASSALEQAGVETAIFVQGASADIQPFDWWDGNPNVSHAERTTDDTQAFGILLATQTIRAIANSVPRRNAPIRVANSRNGDVAALRIGDTVLVASKTTRSTEFAAELRNATPTHNLLIGSNLGATSNSDDDAISATVNLISQITD